MKKLLITHIDLDGILPVVFAKMYSKELQFDGVMREDYGFHTKFPDKYDLVKTFDEIIFADMSIPEETYNELVSLGKHIEFYDHHEASKWIKEKNIPGVWDDTKCGTKLFWEFYIKPKLKRYPSIIEEAVELVDTYDLWKEDSPLWQKAKEFSYLMYGQGFYDWKELDEVKQVEPFVNELINKFENEDSMKWNGEEQIAINKGNMLENKTYNECVKSMQIRKDRKGRLFGLILIGSKISVVCSRILKNNPNLDYLVAISTFGYDISGKISYRTRGKFDLNELAGAAGHPSACGGGFRDPSCCIKLWNNEGVCFIYKSDPEYVEGEERTYLVKI